MQWIVKGIWTLYFLFILYVFFKLNFPLAWKNPVQLLDTMILLPSLVALFGYIYRRRFLDVTLWRIYFCILVTWDFYHHFIVVRVWEGALQEIVFFLILLSPLYLANFMYAFMEREKK